MPTKRPSTRAFPQNYPEGFADSDENASGTEYTPDRKAKKARKAEKVANQPSKKDLRRMTPMAPRDVTDCPQSRGASPEIGDGLNTSGPSPTFLTSDLVVSTSNKNKAATLTALVTTSDMNQHLSTTNGSTSQTVPTITSDLNQSTSDVEEPASITALVTHAADQQVKLKIDLSSILGSEGSITGLRTSDGKFSLDLSAILGLNGFTTSLTITGVQPRVEHENDPELSVEKYNSMSAADKFRYAKRAQNRKRASGATEATEGGEKKSTPTTLLTLPYDIRQKLWRMILVQEKPIDFYFRENFASDGQLLRVSKQLHQEGRAVLYGQNVFHFDRCEDRRGRFWQRDWAMVGWQDVRAFLEDVGAKNLSLMRRISFVVSDTIHAPRAGPRNPANFRSQARYETTLHHCLRIIGYNATNLEKFAFHILCRDAMDVVDIALVDALQTIKADGVVDTVHPRSRKASTITVEAKKKLLTAMTKVHDSPPPSPTYVTKMYYERPLESYWG